MSLFTLMQRGKRGCLLSFGQRVYTYFVIPHGKCSYATFVKRLFRNSISLSLYSPSYWINHWNATISSVLATKQCFKIVNFSTPNTVAMETAPLLSDGANAISSRHCDSSTVTLWRILVRWRGILLSLLAALIYSSKSIIIRLDNEFDFIAISFVALVIQGGTMATMCLCNR